MNSNLRTIAPALNYATARVIRRPKMIVAMGVVAIVFSVFSALTSASFAVGALRGMLSTTSKKTAFGSTTIVYFPPSTTELALKFGENLPSVGLAIYLFVVGILVLRGHRRGAQLQTIFACVKIPLAIFAAVALMWGDLQWSASSRARNEAWLGIAMIAFLGCSYPVMLLMVLRTPGVRAFYRRARLPN